MKGVLLDVQRIKEEQRWIKQAQLGNKDAFTELFHMHYSFLYKYLLKVTMSRELTEDIVQETMLKCYDNIRRYNGRSKFSSWLITIATRLYIDILRKQKREQIWLKHEKIVFTRQLKWQMQTDNLQWLEVMDMMTKLDAEVRMAILLKHYYGFSYDETASILKMKTGTVKSKVHYGLLALRKELKNDERKGL